MINVADLYVSRILFFEIGSNVLVYDYKLKIKAIFEPIFKKCSKDVQVSFIYHIKNSLEKYSIQLEKYGRENYIFPIGLTQRGCSLETLRRVVVFPLKL